MRAIGVVTDSHSGIGRKEAEELGIYVLPMPFYIDGQCYYENITLSREEFFEKLIQEPISPHPSRLRQTSWDCGTGP